MKRNKNLDSTEEQLFDTGTKLIDAYEKIEKLENLLGKAVAVINEMLKDDPDCKYCLWEKMCASGKGNKECMKDAQWKHTGAALKLAGRKDNG